MCQKSAIPFASGIPAQQYISWLRRYSWKIWIEVKTEEAFMSVDKGELQHIFNHYFSPEKASIQFYGDEDKCRIKEILPFFGLLIPYNHPDGYAATDDKLIIFEHFEFDSSKGSKHKGSKQRRSEADDSRAFDAVIPTREGSEYHGTLDASYSIDYYRENFLRSFNDHYSEIPEYKETLKSKGLLTDSQRITTIFFIEDTSIFGNAYDTYSWDATNTPLILLHCDFFLDVFEKSPDLDCVIFGSKYYREKELWYIDHSLITEYRKHTVSTDEIDVFDYTPRSTGYKLLLTPDETERAKTNNE
jgi:hypothetical protein